MAKHTIYFAHGGEQRKKPPPLELILYEMNEDDPVAVEKAGLKYGKWLIQNASGNWTSGLRRALKEHPTMKEE